MTDAMAIDPRERRLPVWVQNLILVLRDTTRDAQAVADAVRGEHTGSNVRLQVRGSLEPVPLPENSYVQFDSKWGKVIVGHDLEGRIRVQGDSRMILRMNAANALAVELED